MFDAHKLNFIIDNRKGDILSGHRDAARHLWNGGQAERRQDKTIGLVASDLESRVDYIAILLNIVHIEDQAGNARLEARDHREESAFIEWAWRPAGSHKIVSQVAFCQRLVVYLQGCYESANSICWRGACHGCMLLVIVANRASTLDTRLGERICRS